MSDHKSDPPSSPGNDTWLEDLYAEGADLEPSPELDRAVLAQASEHLAKKRNAPALSKWNRWAGALASAAVLVLAVGIFLQTNVTDLSPATSTQLLPDTESAPIEPALGNAAMQPQTQAPEDSMLTGRVQLQPSSQAESDTLFDSATKNENEPAKVMNMDTTAAPQPEPPPVAVEFPKTESAEAATDQAPRSEAATSDTDILPIAVTAERRAQSLEDTSVPLATLAAGSNTAESEAVPATEPVSVPEASQITRSVGYAQVASGEDAEHQLASTQRSFVSQARAADTAPQPPEERNARQKSTAQDNIEQREANIEEIVVTAQKRSGPETVIKYQTDDNEIYSVSRQGCRDYRPSCTPVARHPECKPRSLPRTAEDVEVLNNGVHYQHKDTEYHLQCVAEDWVLTPEDE